MRKQRNPVFDLSLYDRILATKDPNAVLIALDYLEATGHDRDLHRLGLLAHLALTDAGLLHRAEAVAYLLQPARFVEAPGAWIFTRETAALLPWTQPMTSLRERFRQLAHEQTQTLDQAARAARDAGVTDPKLHWYHEEQIRRELYDLELSGGGGEIEETAWWNNEINPEGRDPYRVYNVTPRHFTYWLDGAPEGMMDRRSASAFTFRAAIHHGGYEEYLGDLDTPADVRWWRSNSWEIGEIACPYEGSDEPIVLPAHGLRLYDGQRCDYCEVDVGEPHMAIYMGQDGVVLYQQQWRVGDVWVNEEPEPDEED